LSDRETHAIDRLAPFFREWGIRVSPDQAARLDAFLDELMVWNPKINLTGITSRDRLVDELLADSILPVPWLPDTGTLLDVGSGAGFPAIPIKILKPGLEARLIEPRAKKAHFLKQVIRLTRLHDMEVVQGRLEEKSETVVSKGYDVITSRAFAPLPAFVSLCAPFLSSGGCMVAFLGAGGRGVLKESEAALERQGLSPFKRLAYRVPGKGVPREILILKKKGLAVFR